jgi:hypothetical protein
MWLPTEEISRATLLALVKDVRAGAIGGFEVGGVGFPVSEGFSSPPFESLSLGSVPVLALRVRGVTTGGAGGRCDLIQLRSSSSFSAAGLPTR